ncbi:MAG: ECF-type sigma factor [Phycisphaerales bacterium]|jgi:DNA-directed RNA polymerase specialized sigma24 family protein|nr:ECF-type sigma factor [Phycisphaerales bacterium]
MVLMHDSNRRGGMTIEQVSVALDVSPRTVSSEWHYARAWLKERLATDPRVSE